MNTEYTKSLVWVKGIIINGYDSRVWRHDRYGKVMKFSEYGNRDSEHGWEIDHITPLSKGGSDLLTNLQPLNYLSNILKSDRT